jgi:O-antigen/teichoic acid export membrane protein
MSRVGHNFVYLLVSQLATWSITLVALVVVPDLLGPRGFGQIGFAAAYMQFFIIAASLGTAMFLTREVARDHSILARYTYNAVVLKIVSGIVAAVLAVVIAVAIGTEGTKLVLVGLGCFTMLFVIINEVFVGGLAGLQRMGRPAMWSTAQMYAASIGGIVIVVAGGGVIAYSVVLCLAGLIPLIANGRVVWPWTRGTRQLDAAVWKRLVTGGFPLMILSALILLYGTIDIPILAVLSDDATVGWYTLAFRFVGIPVFIANAVMMAMFPTMSAHGVGANTEFVGLVNRSMRLVMLIAVPASLAIAVLADRIIDLLYDERFADAVPILRILALSIPLTTMGIALGTALIASDRQFRYVVIAAVATVLNPIACWFAINWSIDRYDNGAIGAALVTVGTELLITAGALLVRSPGVVDKATSWYFARIFFAAGVMAVFLEVFDDLPLAMLCAFGLAVYGAVSIAVRTVAINDVRGVTGMFTGALRSARNSAA